MSTRRSIHNNAVVLSAFWSCSHCIPHSVGSFFRFHHRCSSALFYRFAVIENKRAVKEQNIASLKVYKSAEIIGVDITNINKRYLCISLDKQRSYTASERITEDNKLFVCRCVRIFNRHKRYRTGEEHLVRILAICFFHVVYGCFFACFVFLAISTSFITVLILVDACNARPSFERIE